MRGVQQQADRERTQAMEKLQQELLQQHQQQLGQLQHQQKEEVRELQDQLNDGEVEVRQQKIIENIRITSIQENIGYDQVIPKTNLFLMNLPKQTHQNNLLGNEKGRNFIFYYNCLCLIR